MWEGGRVAREAKSLIPSSIVWLGGRRGTGQSHYEHLLTHSVRSRDPFQRVIGRWIVRRLSPEANPIEIAALPVKRDEEQLLHAMGTEAANVHLATPRQRSAILGDLSHRGSRWLRDAAKMFAKAVEKDWRAYRG